MERLSRGRAQRIASSRAKWNDNGLKMLPRGLPNRSKIAPRWLPGGSRAPPESANGSGDLSCSFFWPLGRLSGRSWVALGRSWRCLGASWAAPGRSRGAPGRRFGFPGASFGSSLGLFFRRLWKNTKFFKTLVFSMVFDGFGVPGGSKIEPKWLPNRSWARLGASWRSLGASRRCPWRLLAASWRSWGLLGASWGALEAILAQKGNPPDPQPGVDPDRLSPSTLPL